jgi:hypothetical protein
MSWPCSTPRCDPGVAADVLGVVEADNRPVLRMFSDALLTGLGVTPYEQVMRLGACVDLEPLVHPPFQHRNVHMRPTKDLADRMCASQRPATGAPPGTRTPNPQTRRPRFTPSQYDYLRLREPVKAESRAR